MVSFDDYAARKTEEAMRAAIAPLSTLETASHEPTLPGIGNQWTREKYDGMFRLFPAPAGLPAISLVFVQSREGNTGADNPADLGGGPTDLHLIYEGLSRVAADAVMAGATTASGQHLFLSTWHPQLVSLRRDLGLPRHPAQIVVSNTGRLDVDGTLLFNVPDVPVFVLGADECRRTCASVFANRRWITVIPLDSPDLAAALGRLREEHGVRRISAIGGRTTASALLDQQLVQDVCLTTTARSAGEPNTPFYVGGSPPALTAIVRKRSTGPQDPVLFEHCAVGQSARAADKLRSGGTP